MEPRRAKLALGWFYCGAVGYGLCTLLVDLFVSVLVVVHYGLCTLIIIIIMEICKAPTLRFKALNKHTHIMYEMENVIIFFSFLF